MTWNQPLALVALLLAVTASGCCSLFKQPAADNVVASRQFCNDGLCALQENKLDEAEQLFEQALQVSPNDERAHRHYADTLWQNGNHTEALNHMREAVRLGGEEPELLVQLGRMYLSSGNHAAAERSARKALGKQRDLATAWSLLADLDHAAGRSREALAKYHRAIACGDQSDWVRYAVAGIYSETGRDDRALATLNALSERYTLETEPTECLHARGLAMHRLGRHRAAADCMQLAVDRGQPTPVLLVQLSEAQMMAGNHRAARRNLALALDSYPDFGPALRLSQHLQAQSGEVAAIDLR